MSGLFSILNKDKQSDSEKTSVVGRRGEEIAADFLRKNGFRLVISNFRVPIGRNRKGVAVSGEIDLIALERDVLCFIEVKTRRSDEFSTPQAAVDLRKQRQITRTARVYRHIFRLKLVKFRYDVIAIILPQNGPAKIELFRSFWSENKFRKKQWRFESDLRSSA